MTFGFEGEYFLADKAGNIVYNVPIDLPRDAANTLVEVRGEPATHPLQAALNYKDAYDKLKRDVESRDLKLVCKDEHHYPKDQPHWFRGSRETAGLHIHFGGEDAPTAAALLPKLDKVFAHLTKGRETAYYATRPKPWGWEYRRLPATADLMDVVTILWREVYDTQSNAQAPATKAA